MPVYPVRRDADTGRQDRAERPKLMPSDDSKSVFSLLSCQDKERLLGLGRDSRAARSGRSRWGDAAPVAQASVGLQDGFQTQDRHGRTPQAPTELGRPADAFQVPDRHARTQQAPADALQVPDRHARSQRAPADAFESSERPGRNQRPAAHGRASWSLTSSLGAMFKSAGSSTETQDINNCLAAITDSAAKRDSEAANVKALAASQDNYGFMTRTVVSWHPDKLLCKRFNIADPYPG